MPARQILEESVRAGAFPGAVVVAGDDRHVILEVTAGEARTDTIYDVASLTKVVVTTTLAMMLFEDGKLDLDAPVNEYTIRQLLTHTSGLPAAPVERIEKRGFPSSERRGGCAAGADGVVILDDSSGLTTPALLFVAASGRSLRATPPFQGGESIHSHLRRPPLQYQPGTKVIYSDVGFIVLGQIIEDLARKKLDVLASERIFEPLGMKDTSFNPDPSLLPRIAPTGPSIRGLVHDPTAAAMGGVAGHAGLFSTAPDLAIFCRTMLRRDRTIELFTRVDERVAGSTRALGWDTPSEENSAAGRYFSKGSFGHTGFTGTSMWIDPNRRLYVVFLTNRVFSNPGNVQIRDIRPKLHDAVMSSLIPVDARK